MRTFLQTSRRKQKQQNVFRKSRQRRLLQLLRRHGDHRRGLVAPAAADEGQDLGDFLIGHPSTQLGRVTPSYQPGVHLTDLSTALPDFAIAAIREAIPAFDRQIRGFAMPDAVLTGVETRTSSPLRITRGDDLQSVNIKGLYPAGEGAGYAGGILSAGIDGIRVAEAVARAFGMESAG